MREAAHEFTSLLIQVLPYFAAGLTLAVLLRRRLGALSWGKRWLSGVPGVYSATLLGAILPGCCMAAVPMAAGMKAAGASRGVVATFLLTSPLLSPQAFLLTWAVLGRGMALARFLSTVLLLPLMGLGIELWDRRRGTAPRLPVDTGRRLPVAPQEPAAPFWRQWWDLAAEYGRWLLLGMLVAALAAAFLPADLIQRLVGEASGPLAYLAAAAVGVPAYICEGEEVPLAYGLLRLGLGPGPVLTFLLGAVGSCLPTLILSVRLIGRRTTLAVALFWFAFSILAGFLYELCLD